MKTSNRPTASNRPRVIGADEHRRARTLPAQREIADLSHRVRKLWVTGLWDQPDEHEAGTVVLMDLELDLERLSLRRMAETFSVADASELDRCRNLIVALERERAATTAARKVVA